MSRWRFEIGLVVLAVATAIVHSPALWGEFLNWDDPTMVVQNEALRALDLQQLARAVVLGNWHPVTLFSLALEQALFGPDPFVFHLSNLLLHTANSLLVALLLRRLLRGASGVALLCGALFALHPLHVESVAWISERKDVLSTFFSLAAMWRYLGYCAAPSPRRYAVCFALFALAVLSKPIAVTLPIVLLTLDWRLGRGLGLRVWLEKAPFLVGSLVVGVITLYVQPTPPDPENHLIFAGGLGERVVIAVHSLVFYLSKAILPIQLSAYYDAQLVRVEPWQWAVALGALGFAALVIARDRTVRRDVVWGLCFALVTLAPTLKLVPFGFDSLYNDRYLYLPSVGLFVALTVPLRQWSAWPAAARTAAVAACAVVLAVFAVESQQRSAVWRSTEAFWGDVVAKYPGTAMAHYKLGRFYLDERGDPAQAELEFHRALGARPGFAFAELELGKLAQARGDREAAEEAFAAAIAARPYDLAIGFAVGNASQSFGDLEAAVAHYERLLEISPGYVPAHYGLGQALAKQGRTGAARRAFERALELEPTLGPAWEGLARIAMVDHSPRRALELFERAAENGSPVPPQILGQLRRQLGE